MAKPKKVHWSNTEDGCEFSASKYGVLKTEIRELFEDKIYQLTDLDIQNGFIIKEGQKTTYTIEELVKECVHASQITLYNQYF